MTWAELRAAAIEQAAISLLRDPDADEDARRDARAELEQVEPDHDRLSLAELDVWIDLTARATGQEVATDHAQVAERAQSYQEVANVRRDELDATECKGPRIANPRCRRCSEFDDDDLNVLRVACAARQAEQRILDGEEVLALPEASHD